MAGNYFSLGGITLPWTAETLSYGSGHHVVRHDLLGGVRQFDLMGDDPDDIEVSGRITGSNITSYRDQLRALEGTSTTLVVGADSTQVIVLKIKLEQQWGVLGYHITCAVQNAAQPAGNAPTAAQAASVGISQANGLALPATVSSPLQAASSTLANTSVDPSTAVPNLTLAQTAANTQVTSSEAIITTNVGIGDNLSQSALQFTTGMAALTSAYAARAAASQASALIAGAINSLNGG